MRVLVVIALVILAGPTAWADGPVILAGVAENKPVPGKPNAMRIRVAFREKDGLWDSSVAISKKDTLAQVQDHLAGDVPVATWTVCANHKAVAQGTGTVLETTAKWSDLAVAAIRPKKKLPFAGESTLLATAGGHCDDPAGWKPIRKVDPETLDRLAMPMFRASSGIKLCRRDGSTVFYTPDANGITVKQSFRASDGRLLLVVVPHPKDPAVRLCTDKPDTYYNRLFLIDTKKATHYLGASLRIIGSADLGGDGHSVVVVWRDDGNFLGYKLFSDELMRSTEFWWPSSDVVFEKLRTE